MERGFGMKVTWVRCPYPDWKYESEVRRENCEECKHKEWCRREKDARNDRG